MPISHRYVIRYRVWPAAYPEPEVWRQAPLPGVFFHSAKAGVALVAFIQQAQIRIGGGNFQEFKIHSQLIRDDGIIETDMVNSAFPSEGRVADLAREAIVQRRSDFDQRIREFEERRKRIIGGGATTRPMMFQFGEWW